MLYIATACVDLWCITFYSGTFNIWLVTANVILLCANSLGAVAALSMNLIAALCSMSWVLIMISVYLLLLLETFMIADNSGIFLIMMIVPTVIDCIFLCAIMPFFGELLAWFDKSITLEK